MFTGIIQNTGQIQTISALGNGLRLTIHAPDTIIQELQEGDSIAVNGICSTAHTITPVSFDIDYLNETLQKTTIGSQPLNTNLNLELSLTPASRMGGHWVTGHVDETGILTTLKLDPPFGIITVSYSPQFRPFLIPKGSITIDGIALTLVDITDAHFTCHIIPHTIANTNLATMAPNTPVNLEYDILGKYIYNFSQYGK
jgi:riboflavin synthase